MHAPEAAVRERGRSVPTPDGNTPSPAASVPTAIDSAWRIVCESLILLVAGVLLMHSLYGERGGAEIGVPGHDSFYHIRMAALLPEIGLTRTFPWLQFAYFRDAGDEFVSHHYGFHVFLLPFVKLSEHLTGDALAGGRWATCATFGLSLVLLNLLLRTASVPWRWLWLTLLLLSPTQFFFRQALVRAISPSLCFLLLILLLLFRGRWLWAAIATVAFTHLYLGAVLYTPLLIGCFALASIIGPAGARELPWKSILATALAWTVGVVTYPYFGGMGEFLRLQVFGTGLTPDITVGSEWKSYEGVWWFASTFAGPLLGVWAVSLAARVRFGPTFDSREMTLLLLNFAFLVLTLKARRFIEYWPVFSLLSSAYIAAPLLIRFERWRRRGFVQSEGFWPRALRAAFYLYVAAACGALVYAAVRTSALREVFTHWEFAVAAGLSLAWVLVDSATRAPAAVRRVSLRAAGTAVVAAGALSGTALAALPRLEQVRGDTRCHYDLPAIRDVMSALKQRSQPGDVVFTDDWDIFPLYFYYNTHNYYIVGLDPKFTHERRPDLWERYVAVSRGKVPADAVVTMKDAAGKPRDEKLHIELTDIREHFRARFVITDRDHNALATKLYNAPEFAELIHPAGSYLQVRDAPFLLWRVREPGEAFERRTPESLDQNGVLYLSFLDPTKVEQGWGEFRVDRSVTGDPIELGALQHARGLGTHAPSVIRYDIPDGYARFEATAGVDASRKSCGGSVTLSVRLDGREVFTSDVLTPFSEPAEISVELQGARVLELRADATIDGQQCDHVDWGSARLVRRRE